MLTFGMFMRARPPSQLMGIKDFFFPPIYRCFIDRGGPPIFEKEGGEFTRYIIGKEVYGDDV